jgi:hypothetical protein
MRMNKLSLLAGENHGESVPSKAVLVGGVLVGLTGVLLELDGAAVNRDAMNLYNWNLDHPAQARLGN